MPELSADLIEQHIVQQPTSRFNRSVPYKYAGYSFPSAPALAVPPESEDDQYHTVGFGEMFRPDLVAYRFYGDANFWWFLVLVNYETLFADGTLNFLEKFLPGVTLRIPSQQIAYSYINGRQ